MFSQPPLKQILWGNRFLALCCVFYLAWWILAFKPRGAITGIRSGWLLIPAFLTGLLAVALILRGCGRCPAGVAPLIPEVWIVCGGIVLYAVLSMVTYKCFHRQITTELFLIIGWTMLALTEINALLAFGAYTTGTSVILAAGTGVIGLICILCYIPYYNLSALAGYIDGMVPLALAGIMMVVFNTLVRK